MASYKKLNSKCNNLIYKSSCCFRAITINNVITDSQSGSTRSEKPLYSGNRSRFRLHERSSPANCTVSMGFSISNLASAILFTHRPQTNPPCSQGECPSQEGKSRGNKVEANPILVINYHVHMIPIQRVKI